MFSPSYPLRCRSRSRRGHVSPEAILFLVLFAVVIASFFVGFASATRPRAVAHEPTPAPHAVRTTAQR